MKLRHHYLLVVLVFGFMNDLADGQQKTTSARSSSPYPPASAMPPLPPQASRPPLPPQSYGPPLPGSNPPPPNTRPPPPDNTDNCKTCPVAYLAVFIFSTNMTNTEFELIKDTWNRVVQECYSQLQGTRVGLLEPAESPQNVTWVAASGTFMTMRNSLKLANFQVETTLTNRQFSDLILKAIETIGFGQEQEGSLPPPPAEILIVSDLDLALDATDANNIASKLSNSNSHMRYLWVPTSNETSPVNAQSNNIDLIVDPQKTPTYLKDLSELSSDETLMQLAVCRQDPSMFVVGPSSPPQPMLGYPYNMLQQLGPPPQSLQQRRPPPPENNNFNWVLLVAIGGGVIVVVVIVGVLCVVYSNTKFKWKANIEQIRANTRTAVVPNQYFELERCDEWSIRKGHLEIKYEQKLGSGAFCDVFKGKLMGQAPVCKIYPSIQASRSFADCDVAVKMLPTFADDMAKSDFVQEINFMKSLAYHPHLICLLGVAWEGLNEPRLVTEFCIYGDLLHYIRDKKDEIIQGYSNMSGLKIKDLVSFAWQISDGLDYLHSKGCIHRDVAARNILVDYTNSAKIADFGLCRLTERALYTSRGGRLPIKWMALESLKSYEYSFKSDVWSYGVLLFELFSLGEVPFRCHQPADMLEHLEAGNRLNQPLVCPNEIYKIMSRCWLLEPRDRPSFEMIRTEIATILENATANYGYLQVEQTDYVDKIHTQNEIENPLKLIDASLYIVSNAASVSSADPASSIA